MTETTEKKTKHSPTPWRAVKTCTEPCILDANGESVAACWNAALMANANAALIVEAVNAHERLVAENARLMDAAATAITELKMVLEALPFPRGRYINRHSKTMTTRNKVDFVVGILEKARAATGEEAAND